MQRSSNAKSIDDLEGNKWPLPDPSAPMGIIRCYQARQKPISDLSPPDLLYLIGRGVGLRFILDRAICMLEEDPLLEAEHYPGDLLSSVLKVSPGMLRERPELRRRVEEIAVRLPSALKSLDEIDFEAANEALTEALARFRLA